MKEKTVNTSTKSEAAGSAQVPQGIIIKHISFKGRIKRTEADEYAEILNSGGSPVDVAGYKLTTGNPRKSFVFPKSTVLAPGKGVRVYTNHHDPETGGFSFNSKTAIWNNKGDEGVLLDASGAAISRYSYGSPREKASDSAPRTPPTQGAGAGGGDQLSAEKVWAQVKGAWPGFEFMWRPGDTEEDIAEAEERLGIKLTEDVRQLMKVCSGAGAGFPRPFSTVIAAEVCLRPVQCWQPIAHHRGIELPDPAEFEEEHFKEHGIKDVVVIGENPAGADYGIFVILESSTGRVSKFQVNDGYPEPIGSFEKWLLGRRAYPGSDQVQAYVGSYGYDDAAEDIMSEDDFEGAKTLAKSHAGSLRYSVDSKYLLKAWSAVESQFVETVDRLNKR